jgi:hypothetical protein
VAAPTLIDYAESTWTDPSVTTETTDDLNWDSAGDVIVVLGATEDNGLAMATPTGTGLTLSALSGLPTATGSSCKVYGWSATAAGDGNAALASTNGASGARGIAAWSWSGSAGLGTPVVNVGSGVTVSVTVAADSSVVMVLADWNATTDVTVDTTPAGGTIRQANAVSGLATFLVVQWDAQAAGTRSYGVSNWTGTGTVSKAAVEVLGAAGASPAPTTATGTGAAGAPAVAATITAGQTAATGTAFDATAGTALAAEPTGATGSATAYSATVSTGGGSQESLFVSWTPTSGNENDGTPLTRGLTFYAAVAGNVLGVRVYATTTVSTSIETVNLWLVTAGEADPGPGTGTELAEKAAVVPLASASWNDILFDAPVAISANTAYKVGSSNDQGRYVATAADLLTDVTVGNLTAVGASGSGTFPLLGTIRNGTYEYAAAGTYPNDFSGAPNYGIDVIFQASAGGDETDAPATEAAGTGVAYEPTVALEAQPAEAAAVGVAVTPAAALGVAATTTTAVGVAQDPTVSASASGTASAGTASASGEALWDAGSTVALDLIADNPVEATGAAYNATVSTAAAAGPTPAEAAGTGTVANPTVTTSSSATAPATEASAGGAALGPASAITALAIEATAAGVAFNPTVSTVPLTNADAGLATATGSAIGPVAAVQVLAAAAAAAAQAFGPSVLIGGPGQATAGAAAATGSAFPARVHKRIPRPSTGTTTRPFAGVTVRP